MMSNINAVKTTTIKKITDLQAYQIKCFIKNGGDPQDYVPPAGFRLDNNINNKKRYSFTVTQEQKILIDMYLRR